MLGNFQQSPNAGKAAGSLAVELFPLASLNDLRCLTVHAARCRIVVVMAEVRADNDERAGLTGLADNQKVTYDVESGRDGRQNASNIALA